MPVIGQLLNNRYRLDSELGRGGMGIIYRALDTLLERSVAVKFLSPPASSESGPPGSERTGPVLATEGRTRLLHEARATARLNHPNIVSVHDVGEADGALFIVMELIEGHTLYDHGPTDLDAIISWASQICAALEHAHTHGIIHRDLKPENVMILPDGSAKIMDFGLASSVASRLLTEGMVMGTVFYLAPEQASGQEIDHRVDLYSLGVLLYELASGQLPFTGDNPVAVLGQHFHAPVIPPSIHNPEIPATLDSLIVQLLSKQPGDRPASAAEVQQRLEDIRRPAAGALASFPGIPEFLKEEGIETVDRPVVAAREQEIERLDQFLGKALQGQGQVVFVTGEAGSGKTTLLSEFARRAEQAHVDLLVSVGACNAHAGIGDAYLPFREVLGMFTGDLESRWAAGAISREGARRLWAALPLATHALVRNGQDLVDLLVPGQALIARLEAGGFAQQDLLAQIQALAGQEHTRSTELEQALIFEQYTKVLVAMAAQKAVVVVLDDLQWADQASIGLLYHLGRRIGGSRVLILAAYRPDEVAAGRDGTVHPLEKVLMELKRYSGDIWVDLGRAQETRGRRFIDALVDTEPNRLGPEFREKLYSLTGGHALFTVELLRAMEERGDLIRDREGYYTSSQTLDWRALPARVDGVIEERIGRLDQELQDTLAVASVEGQTFTVQVIARVRDEDERKLIRQFGRELDQKHRLVGHEGTRQVGGQRLHRYRFRQNLFQRHLYSGLDAFEREYLHEDIATALEMIYGDEADQIAPQLAYHYHQASNAEKARRYLVLAGDQARARYANQEAIDYYSQALELTPEIDLEASYVLLLARARVYALQGNRENQTADLALLAILAEESGDAGKQAEAALSRGEYEEQTGSYQESISAVQQAIACARESGDTEQEIRANLVWGRSLTSLGDYGEACKRLASALELAQAAGLAKRVADSLRNLGEAAFYSGDYIAAQEYHEQALSMSREVGDRRGEGMALNSLGMVASSSEDCAGARRYYEQALAIAREIGDRQGEETLVSNLGYEAFRQGDYAGALAYYRLALAGFRQVGARLGEATILSNVGLVALAQGDDVAAHNSYRRALSIVDEIGNRWLQGYILTGLGEVLARMGQLDEAAASLQQAVELRQEMRQLPLEMETRAGLARVALARGDRSGAQIQVDHILAYLDSGQELGGTEIPFLIHLTCIRVLYANQDPRADQVLGKAYRLLQEQAAGIPDEATRRAFLEKIPWNREIAQIGAEQGLQGQWGGTR
jgi:adenylate cyclase